MMKKQENIFIVSLRSSDEGIKIEKWLIYLV